MKKNNLFSEKEVYKKMRKSPIYFVKLMWGLVPQPIKPAFQSRAKECLERGELDKFEAHWFQDFVFNEHISWQQWLILKSVELAIQDKKPKRITISSGHGIGKSTVIAWLILWFLFCFYEAQVPCTAPTSDQIHDILWKEAKRWIDEMPEGIKEQYEWKSEYIRMADKPETWFARAKTARKEKPEALAGMHGKHLMMLVDEASGVAREIFATAEGSMTNENPLFIMISNPTRITGFFYESHHDEKALWQTLQFNSEESPIVSADYIDRMRLKYGEDSDEYGIRVLGKFPEQEGVDNKGYVPLIKKEQLEACFTNDRNLTQRRKMMIDPSEEGSNKSVWGIMDRYKAMIIAQESTSQPKSIANKTHTLQEHHEFSHQEKEDTFIDSFGVGAKSAVEIGRDGNVSPIPVNGGDRVDENMLVEGESVDMFLNVRSLMFWRLRQFIIEGGELVKHPGWEQLLWIKYRRTTAGKIQIIPKREIVKEHGESPDFADTLSLGFYTKRDNLRMKKMEQDMVLQNRIRRKESRRTDVGL